FKFGVIVPLAQELLEFSRPDALTTIRRTVLGGLARSLDQQFLLPTVTAVAGVNPASITNGATEITSTGSTAAAIATDLKALLAANTTPGTGLRWVLRPMTLATVAWALGAAAPDVPRTLYGIPLVVSVNSPAQITLVDGAGILYSDAGQ